MKWNNKTPNAASLCLICGMGLILICLSSLSCLKSLSQHTKNIVCFVEIWCQEKYFHSQVSKSNCPLSVKLLEYGRFDKTIPAKCLSVIGHAALGILSKLNGHPAQHQGLNSAGLTAHSGVVMRDVGATAGVSDSLSDWWSAVSSFLVSTGHKHWVKANSFRTPLYSWHLLKEAVICVKA